MYQVKETRQKWFASMNVTDHLQVLHFDGMCAGSTHISTHNHSTVYYTVYYIESSKTLYLSE